jgi:hypothetical protein
VRQIDSMNRPGEVTTSELEASQVFAAHVGGIGAAATTSAVNERRRRRTPARMRAGPVTQPPVIPTGGAVWRHRIMCDGGANPNPGPTGCGVMVATGELTTDIAPGCKRKKTGDESTHVPCTCGLD